MMHRLTRLRKDQRGAALMEFALIAPIFALLIMGMLDIGHSMYVKGVLEGVVQKAGRDSMLQTGPTNAVAIDASVRTAVTKVANTATVTTTRTAYADFANVGAPEPFVDGNANAVRNNGECYQDVNRNGVWDVVAGGSGQGAASDAVVYTVTMTYPHFFPLPSLLNMFPGAQTSPMSTMMSLSASTLLRNQPYAVYAPPLVVCTP